MHGNTDITPTDIMNCLCWSEMFTCSIRRRRFLIEKNLESWEAFGCRGLLPYILYTWHCALYISCIMFRRAQRETALCWHNGASVPRLKTRQYVCKTLRQTDVRLRTILLSGKCRTLAYGVRRRTRAQNDVSAGVNSGLFKSLSRGGEF